MKTHIFTPNSDFEKPTELNWVSDQTCWFKDGGGTDVKLPTRVAFKPYKCRAETCTFETVSQEELSRHLYMEHEVAESVDYQVAGP